MFQNNKLLFKFYTLKEMYLQNVNKKQIQSKHLIKNISICQCDFWGCILLAIYFYKLVEQKNDLILNATFFKNGNLSLLTVFHRATDIKDFSKYQS